MNEFYNKNLYDETQNNEASEITNISEDTTTTASPIEENITEEASENHIDIDHISNDTDDMHYDYTNSGYSMATPPEPKKRYTYGKSIAAGLAGVILCGSAFGFFCFAFYSGRFDYKYSQRD